MVRWKPSREWACATCTISSIARARKWSYFMPDEIPPRSGEEAHAGTPPRRRPGEHSPLQVRAAFIQDWGWESIVSLNRGSCERGRAQFGYNRETHERVRQQWEEARPRELTFGDLLEFLFQCHRSAPFLFFNGNTFAEVARRGMDALLAEFPLSRRREAASLAAHYVAGVLDWDSLCTGLESLTETSEFKSGDCVQTLKGSTRGIVIRRLEDGRVVWCPDGSQSELMSPPENLLREKGGHG